ncbi:MAG: 50S ribosomal protein L18 [Candidatus Margulisbacteria bacterium]|nr:50S ribosomal protein L18 [Candidatus Margulisiibacteriota bacterium]
MVKLKKDIKGQADRPRLVVSKSLKNIYAQIIDDTAGKTLIGISSASLKKGRGNIKVADMLGELIATQALEKGIKKVVFDRAGHIYHGRIKAVAEAARKKGLEF